MTDFFLHVEPDVFPPRCKNVSASQCEGPDKSFPRISQKMMKLMMIMIMIMMMMMMMITLTTIVPITMKMMRTDDGDDDDENNDR